MAKKTKEDLGIASENQESDKEREIQSLINEAMAWMDAHENVVEVRVGLAGPYRKFVKTMFPGIDSVAGGIVASSLNSLHVQIRQPVGYPRVAFIRQKLFRCDIDIVFTETPGFSVFLLPLHDKSLKEKDEAAPPTKEEEGEGKSEPEVAAEPDFIDSTEGQPKRLAISMLYDLTKSYKEQMEAFQKEALTCIQQFCTLREESASQAKKDEE